MITNAAPASPLEVFTTCPPATSSDAILNRPGFYSDGGDAYLRRVTDAARWAEECGFKGILIYIDNSLANNWALAQVVIENTQRLVPLLAVQPLYMHPFWLAKQIATLGHLYGRRIALNMLAGAFVNDLTELGDHVSHDERYERMTDYTLAVRQLLEADGHVTYKGKYYTLNNVKMKPPLAKELAPIVLMSGASEAGMASARRLGAVAVRYPKPVGYYEQHPLEDGIEFGTRVGIIAREYEEDAWAIAHARFPVDRRGQLAHQLTTKITDSVWHKDLTALKEEELTAGYPYWMVPFQNYKTFCPYLVGTYRQVADVVARYIAVGFKIFITDIPPDKEELFHQKIVFELAKQAVMKQQMGVTAGKGA
ncbi:MAG: LLM class flavin-dependent oxidoreductase [Nitrospirae bacterium]|nr:LLM class flavin-dependent oxidoreductase [Nitrospirota bacterium]